MTVLAARVNAQSATFLDYHTTVPSTWTTRAPSSSSRLGEYVVPASSAGPSAEVVVYFFGARMGGNVDANVARWRDAFTNGGVGPTFEKISRDSTGAFPITYAEFHGTYRRGIGAGSADSVRAGQALIASIVETSKGALFIQIFGPEGRVVAERETFMKFVKGLEP
ncbi:MAG TPA: hypothetical protein VN706_15620 [Gemmatimonadaceae bacterium]|nr:hypothetical protein [Gemmatimonadaceae bacterium]